MRKSTMTINYEHYITHNAPNGPQCRRAVLIRIAWRWTLLTINSTVHSLRFLTPLRRSSTRTPTYDGATDIPMYRLRRIPTRTCPLLSGTPDRHHRHLPRFLQRLQSPPRAIATLFFKVPCLSSLQNLRHHALPSFTIEDENNYKKKGTIHALMRIILPLSKFIACKPTQVFLQQCDLADACSTPSKTLNVTIYASMQHRD